ncbi:hypothetical protein L916_03378, partial [Phytophthora nicotianae]
MIQYLRKLVRVTVTVISELYRHDRANTVNLGNKVKTRGSERNEPAQGMDDEQDAPTPGQKRNTRLGDMYAALGIEDDGDSSDNSKDEDYL